MTAYPNDRFENAYLTQMRMSPRRRIGAVATIRVRRTPDRRLAAPGGMQSVSIEETIARYIDANPAQLYRGGA